MVIGMLDIVLIMVVILIGSSNCVSFVYVIVVIIDYLIMEN